MPIFCTAKAWEEYGIEYAVHKELWRGCVLATLGPQPDKGDKARDLTVYRNHGTLTGATHLPTWSNQSYRGQAFRAVTFDGTEDLDALPSISIGTIHTSVAWVRPTTQTGSYNFGPVVGNSTAGGDNTATVFVSNADDTLFGYSYAAGAVSAAVPSMTATWHCLCSTRSGVTIGLYYDGLYIGGGNISGNNPATIDRLCLRYDAFKFDGSVAGVSIHTRILTADEISTLALHPLEAYRVRLPEYFLSAPEAPAAAPYWIWARQRQSQIIGGGVS